MHAPRLKGPKDAARWQLVFMLLSLEKTLRFWPEMGLALEGANGIRERARLFVRAYREIANNTSLTSDERVAQYQEALQETFERVSREAGEQKAHTLAQWGSLTFQYDTESDAQSF